jgi:MFS family permease
MTFADKLAGTVRAMSASDCNWSQFDLGWTYTLFFVVLGLSAALFGPWVERRGPRIAGLMATACWCAGLTIGGVGVRFHALWLMWLGTGLVGGVGLGIGYISPVSTLMKWFPDRRGMAAGLAIAGFGGGAMIGSPLATLLMASFEPGSAGVARTLYCMAAIYAVFMTFGSLAYRIPPAAWRPAGWIGSAGEHPDAAGQYVHVESAHRTPQFWLLWLMLCMNVSAGIGVIGAASPMLQETFGGVLSGRADLSIAALRTDPDLMKRAASVAAGFVGLLSLFNILGRFFWASASDRIGRRTTYIVFFTAGIASYLLAAHAADTKSLGLFVGALCLIASMYGGGFATIPAFLADLFGSKYVGAIHGRLLTAWSMAGIFGPIIVNTLHDLREQSGRVSPDMIYGSILTTLAVTLGVGLIATLLVRPVADIHLHSAETPESLPGDNDARDGMRNQAEGTFSWSLGLAWLFVLIPIGFGLWMTGMKTLVFFR